MAERGEALLLVLVVLDVLVELGDAALVGEPERLARRLHHAGRAVEGAELARERGGDHLGAALARRGDDDDLGGAHDVHANREEVAVGALIIARHHDLAGAGGLDLGGVGEEAAAVAVGAGAEQHHVHGGHAARVVDAGVGLEQLRVLGGELGGRAVGAEAVHVGLGHADGVGDLERTSDARQRRHLLVTEEDVHLGPVGAVSLEVGERGDDRSAGDAERERALLLDARLRRRGDLVADVGVVPTVEDAHALDLPRDGELLDARHARGRGARHRLRRQARGEHEARACGEQRERH
mmetsp:Transcript_31164/g.73980  ORF Transcript_31164/g.73980 Transcript_31164/m.73980 type:complete len:295 (-) Transcript_31164:32-916(-)